MCTNSGITLALDVGAVVLQEMTPRSPEARTRGGDHPKSIALSLDTCSQAGGLTRVLRLSTTARAQPAREDLGRAPNAAARGCKMRDPFGQHASEMPLIEWNHPIGTLATYGPNQAFAIRVGLRCCNWRLDEMQPNRAERTVHRGREDGIMVVHDEAMRALVSKTPTKLLHGLVTRRPLSRRDLVSGIS